MKTPKEEGAYLPQKAALVNRESKLWCALGDGRRERAIPRLFPANLHRPRWASRGWTALVMATGPVRSTLVLWLETHAGTPAAERFTPVTTHGLKSSTRAARPERARRTSVAGYESSAPLIALCLATQLPLDKG